MKPHNPTPDQQKAVNWWNGTLSLNEQNALAVKHLGALKGYITDYGLTKHISSAKYYELREDIWKKEGKPNS